MPFPARRRPAGRTARPARTTRTVRSAPWRPPANDGRSVLAGARPARETSARAVQDDRLAAGVELAVFLQLLEHPAGHLARAADDARQLLARDPQLGAVRVAHGLRLVAQVVQGAGDAVGDVQERQAAGLAAGVDQAPGQLRTDGVQEPGG